MAFPIYNCGTLLFRDGLPAMSLDCCCKYYVCCGDCFFPVSPVVSEPDNFVDLGGPTQIINYKQVITWDPPILCDDGETIVNGGEWNQVGLSKHLVNSAGFPCFADDESSELIIVKYSRCTFVITIDFTPDGLCPGDTVGQTSLTIRYMGNGIWNIGSFGSFNAAGGCDGIISHTFTQTGFPNNATVVTTFEVVRVFPDGKSATDYDCPHPDGQDALGFGDP